MRVGANKFSLDEMSTFSIRLTSNEKNTSTEKKSNKRTFDACYA